MIWGEYCSGTNKKETQKKGNNFSEKLVRRSRKRKRKRRPKSYKLARVPKERKLALLEKVTSFLCLVAVAPETKNSPKPNELPQKLKHDQTLSSQSFHLLMTACCGHIRVQINSCMFPCEIKTKSSSTSSNLLFVRGT